MILFIIFTIFTIIGFQTTGVEVSAAKLPSFINVCYRDDPQLNSCILKEARRVQKQFADGIPELGVEPLDPLYLGSMQLFPKNYSVRLLYENATLVGFKNTDILDLRVDFKKKTGIINMIGNVTVTADYNVSGNIYVLPIQGAGKSILNLQNTNLTLTWAWRTIKGEDGLEYLKMTKYNKKYDIEKASLKLENLFNGNKEEGDDMNNFLNNNWREIIKRAGPPSMKVIQRKIVNILNNFYSQVPFDELLPLRSKIRNKDSNEIPKSKDVGEDFNPSDIFPYEENEPIEGYNLRGPFYPWAVPPDPKEPRRPTKPLNGNARNLVDLLSKTKIGEVYSISRTVPNNETLIVFKLY